MGFSAAILQDNGRDMAFALSLYIEFLHKSGRPYNSGKNAVLAVQHRFRHLRRCLQEAWDDLVTWRMELPVQPRRPAPELVVWALFSQSLLSGLSQSSTDLAPIRFGICCLLMFRGLLRPAEMWKLRFEDVTFIYLADRGEVAVLRLIAAKNQRAMGRWQSIVIRCKVVVRWLKWLAHGQPRAGLIMVGGRKRFLELLETTLQLLHLQKDFIRPSSFRAGGATALFVSDVEISKIKVLGRWKQLATLDYYLQEASAALVEADVGPNLTLQLHQLLVCCRFLRRPPAQPLPLWKTNSLEELQL